jgi:hypothetical protein
MSIATVAAGVKSTVALTDNFQATGSNKNVTIGDWKVLDTGVQRAVIIEYQPSDTGSEATPMSRHGAYSALHRFVLHVFQKYEDDETTYTNLLTDAGNVLIIMDQYSKLNSTTGVVKSEVTNTSEVLFGGMINSEGPFFAIMDLTLEVTEEFDVDFQ